MDTDFFDDIKKNRIEDEVKFWGVVEQNDDPLTLGRVKVRCFHYHSSDMTEIPTDALPWATVLQPTNSSSISGIGDFTPIQLGTWVYGFFADGRDAQFPIVTHTVPGIHRPEPSGTPSGTSEGFLNTGDYNSGSSESDTKTWLSNNAGISSDGTVDYSGESPQSSNPATQGDGSITAVGDINMLLQPKDASKFKSMGITTYTADPCPNGFACKDGMRSMRFHYGTALAFEKLTKNYGRGKLYLNSAYRTPAYNRKCGGAKTSQHMAGRALDVAFSGVGGSKAELAKFGAMAVKCGFVGFGIYWKQRFIHIDTGSGRVWNGAKEKWFIDAIKAAGWFPGKKGLSGISTNGGTESPTSNNATQSTDSTTPSSVNTSGTNQEYIRDRLKAEGYSDAQVAGVMGHINAESRFNPQALNGNDRGLPAYGLVQWRGDRYRALQQYTGSQTPNIQQQTDFLIHELKTSESGTDARLRNSTSVADATVAFSSFERFQGYKNINGSENQKRLKYAQQFYNDGSLPSSNTNGFADPTNSLPTPEYRGEPSTNMAARGFNTYSSQHHILAKDAGRSTGFPAAGDIGTFGEPELQAAPQYPFNSVRSSRTGHLLEMDDTPGSERVNLEHGSGTSIEMFADGSLVERTKGNQYNTVDGDSFIGVNGKQFITSINDMHIRSTADATIQADGSMNLYMGNDGNLMISGDYLVSVGDDCKFQAKRIIIEASESIDILSHKSVNIEGRQGVTIKSGKNLDIQGVGEISLKSPSIISDDIWKHGDGKSRDVKGAESADIGAPPPKKVIEKNNLTNSANRKGTVTTAESYSHYSGGEI